MCCASVEDDNEYVSPANSSVTLNCTLSLTGTVTWFRNNKEIEATNKEREYVLEIKDIGEF